MAVNHPVAGSSPAAPANDDAPNIVTSVAMHVAECELYVRSKQHNFIRGATLDDLQKSCKIAGLNLMSQDIKDELCQLRKQNSTMIKILQECNKFLNKSCPAGNGGTKQISQKDWWLIVKKIGHFFETIK
tara:strand:- start:26 stop:415 length:390 start_codon:yes stop_codon:yes gene_type:complete